MEIETIKVVIPSILLFGLKFPIASALLGASFYGGKVLNNIGIIKVPKSLSFNFSELS
jgi:hypothetical protein